VAEQHTITGGTVVGADPQQPPQYVGDVAAEQPTIGVQLVDYDDAKLLEELEPFRVVRQDSGVEHVGVRHYHLTGRSDGGSDRVRCVPVVGGCVDLEAGGTAQRAQLRDLVLAQGLGREKVQSPCRGIVGQGLQRRHEIAQRLARSCGRHDDHVLAGSNGLYRLGLMAIQAGDASRTEAGHDARIEPLRHRDEVGGPGRDRRAMDDAAGERRFGQDLGQHSLDAGRLVVAHRRTSNRTSVRIVATV
jgi:hypothetical protein